MEQGSNKGAIIAIIVVIALFVGGFGIYQTTRSEDREQEAAIEQTQNDVADLQEEVQEVRQNIVALAVATSDLSTLVSAVQAAELVDTLSGDGPFTVLAPTNAAFAALPAGTLDTLLLPENQADLQGILTYHVIAGNVLSSDLSNGQVVTTVNGETLTVEITDAGVFFVDANGGKAQVTTADVSASNGTVHIIDAVLLP
jgi:uncharacterized surface protein with fasciclin (FAS1) repeats